MKTFKRKPGQSEKKRRALRFALNEKLGDLAMFAEHERTPENADERTYSTEELMELIRRRYVGRFRTKRLRKKHSDLL